MIRKIITCAAFLMATAAFAQTATPAPQTESLKLVWPEKENWKIGDDQVSGGQHVTDYIHSNETFENWTELGNMISLQGANPGVEKAMNMMFDEARQSAPEAKLTLIEKDEKATYPWIIFTIETPKFTDDPTPESQLWYIVQGKQALYTNFRAVKQASITAEQKKKWIKFFKTAKVVTG